MSIVLEFALEETKRLIQALIYFLIYFRKREEHGEGVMPGYFPIVNHHQRRLKILDSLSDDSHLKTILIILLLREILTLNVKA